MAGIDTDGDRISDEDEGRVEGRDSDHDGTPDYLDDDSDNDGISDAIEAGDTLRQRHFQLFNAAFDGVDRLVYYEVHRNVDSAITREKQKRIG